MSKEKPMAHSLCPSMPTQKDAATGVRFDFNCGARVQLPGGSAKPTARHSADDTWHVTIWDTFTGTVFADGDHEGGSRIYTMKKYFVPWAIRVRNNVTGEEFTHAMDLRGRKVAVHILVSTIGDVMAWFPYIERFTLKHGCDMHVCFADGKYKPLFRKQYPALKLTTSASARDLGTYASYMLGLWWGGDTTCQPCDHRIVGLAQTAGWILGVDTAPERPRLDLSAPRRIAEPYVCVAAQSSTMSKNWHAEGWRDIVHTLKACGWRVLCIDRKREEGAGKYVCRMPEGAEDFTGDKPLQERIDLIKDCDFFIGMCSGLAWIAWACGVPVVMIGGFSHPLTEFATPYRVFNPHFCNSCWNDVHFDFDHNNWLWCPRHKGTEREHECMRNITAEHVMRVITTIPIFRERVKC